MRDASYAIYVKRQNIPVLSQILTTPTYTKPVTKTGFVSVVCGLCTCTLVALKPEAAKHTTLPLGKLSSSRA